MIKSMTGYGSAKGFSGKIDITVEVKSYNNRYLDCSVRLPRVYSFAEDPVKSLVQSYVSRGKVEVYINIDSSNADDVIISLNEPLLKAYISALETIGNRYGIKNDISVMSLSRFPDILQIKKEEADIETVSADICSILKLALDDFNAMREHEGEKLYGDIISRLDEIKAITEKIEERSPHTVSEYRARLEQRMSELLSNTSIDESRILMEAAIFADKVAVNEETVRLRSHIDQLTQLLTDGGAVGRKLDFLIQEFNREANTIGSKCNDVSVSKLVVDLKAEIEKIREQVQNIE